MRILHVVLADISTHTKILLGYIQAMRAFQSFDYVRWPPMFSKLLQLLDVPLELELVPADCVAGWILSFYDRLVAMILVPWLGSAFLVVLATVVWAARGRSMGWRLPVLLNSPTSWTLHVWVLLLSYLLLILICLNLLSAPVRLNLLR